MPKKPEWTEKTYICEACHNIAVKYQPGIFSWICFECGEFDRSRNKRASIMNRPVLEFAYITENQAKLAANESLNLLPDGWQSQIFKWDPEQDLWAFRLVNQLISLRVTSNKKWRAMCGVLVEGVICGGPWTTKTEHDHPGKAAVHEAEAMGDFVQDHFDRFQIVGDSCTGLDEFITPEKTI